MRYVNGKYRSPYAKEDPLDLGPYAPLNEFWGVFCWGNQVLTFYTRTEAEVVVDALPPPIEEWEQNVAAKPTEVWVEDPDWHTKTVQQRMKIVRAWAGRDLVMPRVRVDGRRVHIAGHIQAFYDEHNRKVLKARNYLARSRSSELAQPPLFSRRGKGYSVRREYLVRNRRPGRD